MLLYLVYKHNIGVYSNSTELFSQYALEKPQTNC